MTGKNKPALPQDLRHLQSVNDVQFSDDVRKRLADSFFGFFPTWQMFTKEIGEKRDQSVAGMREENYVLIALDKLADLNGLSHETVRGTYYVVQNGSASAEVAHDWLLALYNKAAHDFGRPAGPGP